MICLSVLIYVPKKLLLVLSLLTVFGHNLLDDITVEGNSFSSTLWYILHQWKWPSIPEERLIIFFYPLIPWFAVMALGYCFGFLYQKGFNMELRKKYLLYLGTICLVLFYVIRGINIYGDPAPWSDQKDLVFTFLSFFNVSKYPPSLLYLLVTLGPMFIVLHLLEGLKNKLTDFLLVFGRVPFFYYLMHVFVIHLAALLTLVALGKDWTLMILTPEWIFTDKMADYGYSLGVVYLVWILVVLFLYPFCKKYMVYKLKHKEKWWLSYL